MSYSYPSCANTIQWSKCANNCDSQECRPCTSKPGDPCEVSASGIGCVPKSCVNQCCIPLGPGGKQPVVQKLSMDNTTLSTNHHSSGWGIL